MKKMNRAGGREPTRRECERLYTKRKDGRWQGYYYDLDANGEPIRSRTTRHILCDRDPVGLYRRIEEKHTPIVLTFGEVLNRWQREKWETLTRNSIAAYKPCLRRILEEFGEAPLDAITIKDVTAFLNSLGAQGYAKRSVEIHKTLMNEVYDYAILHNMVSHSPTDHAKIPRNLPVGSYGIASDEAIEAVKNNLDKPFGLYPYLLLYSGLRRGEALALRYEDIDRKEMVIHVTKAVEFDGNAPYLKEPKTEAGIRDVILLGALADAIPLGIGYLFPNPKDPLKPMTFSQFRTAWDRYRESVGGLAMTPHQFRHAYATILEKANVGWKARQTNLGHSNIQTTMNLYTHYDAEQRGAETNKLNEYVSRSLQSGDCNGDCNSAGNG